MRGSEEKNPFSIIVVLIILFPLVVICNITVLCNYRGNM